MSKKNWNVDNVTKEELVEHLEEFHQVSFSDRKALDESSFLEEHFPMLLKEIQDANDGFLNNESKKRIEKAHRLVKLALKECEINKIPVARVFDLDEKDIPTWRICKPTQIQIEYLNFKRWMRIIEGLANKSLLQGNLIEEKAINEVLKDIKQSIIEGQKKRMKIKMVA